MKKALLEKIRQKTAVLGVVGLGYVGLPLAVEKAKAGYRTIGFDIQQEKVAMVNAGKNYIGDIVPEDLAAVVSSAHLSATEDYSKLKEIDCVAICVPTPLDLYQQPDVSYVVNSAQEIAKYLHSGMLIVLESTTYPGTTEEIIKPILEATGLKTGKDFYLAFSPERVDPGNQHYNTKNTPKVVGGVTSDCTEVAAALYEEVLEGDIHTVSSPAVAEMEKILENTFRILNIGLANEMALICNKMGIDVWEVVDAAKSKPYGFMPFYPGPGVGGHCIPIDPFYLTWKAREYNYHTRLIETAGEINNSMPEFVVDRAMKILNRFGQSLKGAKVLVLGVAYKQDIDDVRQSPALEVIANLEKYEADITYHDPFVASFSYKGKSYESAELTKPLVAQADLVILTTMHTGFDYGWIARHARMIFDTKNAFKEVEQRGNIEKL
ncbi:MAG: nucleotide sugar dehydrogenase [Sporomusaceae bacterium]|nr:nucleotide sugar dehydrogenase [Sporomusaceae bacterium]